MPTPTIGGVFSIVSVSGNPDIDALISTQRWGSGGVGATTITYSFPSVTSLFSTDSVSGYGPTSGTGEPWHGFRVLTSYEQQQVRAILKSISNVANVSFLEVPDNATSAGDIRYAYSPLAPNVLAHAYFPAGTYNSASKIGTSTTRSGDVWINSNYYYSFYPEEGSQEYFVILHETLHALGLKHPFEGSITGVTLPTDRNVVPMTDMAYNEQPGARGDLEVYPTKPMPLDIMALQYLYGANTASSSGNDTYIIDTNIKTWDVIWDSGGDDTIQISGSYGVHLDLTPGAWSNVNAYGMSVDNLVWPETLDINVSTIIENATGGSGNDNITGNNSDNKLSGGLGNDQLYGGQGNDSFDWDPSNRAGDDIFYGGPGNDIFVLDSSFDKVVEYAAEGEDTVWVDFSYSMANIPSVENLYAIGTIGLSLTGNSEDNILRGTPGNDIFDGGAGIDNIEYNGPSVNYTIASVAGGITVSSATTGMDTLKNIEYASFTDRSVALVSVGAINIYGTPNNDFLVGTEKDETIYGYSGNDDFVPGLGNDIVYGGDGDDTFDWHAYDDQRIGIDRYYGGPGDDYYSYRDGVTIIENMNEGNDTIWVSGSFSLVAYPSIENLRAVVTKGDSVYTGNSNNNILEGDYHNDTFDGLGGIDTIHYGGSLNLNISKNGNEYIIFAFNNGADTIANIERLQFTDKKIALDLTPDGNAGQAMAFVGLIAPSLLNNNAVRGTIISLFDQGNTMEQLCQLALDINLAPKTSNADLANFIYQNVIGDSASQDMTNALVGYIESHSQANFLATVAGMHINVDLVGLQQTGIEYTI